MKNILYTIILSFFFSSSVFGDLQAGKDAYNVGDYETALKEFRPLAEQGDADALFYLGVMYERGKGVTQDYKEALKWYRLAATQGDVTSQFHLGKTYEDGDRVIQDYNEAVKWYRLAAEQGDVTSQFYLGTMYLSGRGVIKDYVIAHMWLNISASNGNEGASELRGFAENRMTSEKVAKAQKLARECIEKNYKDCG